MSRIDKENYYLDIAQTVLERSTCLCAQYGALIVRNDEIVSTGYNGAPRGRSNCIDLGYCIREKMNIPQGERYELCRSVHAEANAIISASRSECIGGTIYLVGRNARTGEYLEHVAPCPQCRRLIINAGTGGRGPRARGIRRCGRCAPPGKWCRRCIRCGRRR